MNRHNLRRPTLGQGCVIALAGLVLMFFSCVGALAAAFDETETSNALTIVLSILTLVTGLLFVYGTVWMIVRGFQAVMRKRSGSAQ
jgi:hypothetical protein